VEGFHAVAGRIAERNHLGSATLVRHGSRFTPDRDASRLQPCSQCVESRRVGDLLTEKLLSVGKAAVEDEALLAIVHAEGPHGAATINRLEAKLAACKARPIVEL
jgi:hypothetical protein